MDYKPSALAIELYSSKAIAGKELSLSSWCIALLIREVQWFYWTQELLVPVEKFTVRMAMVRLELATLDYKPSALAIELYSSKAIAGKELSLSSWCIALLIREVQWFYWTQELLVPVEKFTVRMPMVRLELATLDYKPSALAIELYSSKAIAGKELSLSSQCIASLYIYHFSTVIDFSSEKNSGSTGHRNSWYQWRNLQ